jgi:manganese/zinc/iron transport system substrate-binding protein
MRSRSLRIRVVILLAAIVLSLSGCASEDGSQKTFDGTYPIKAVATTGMVADLVKNIGGKHVQVTQLITGDGDPHGYRTTAADVRTMQESDIIFFNGRNLEGKMGDVFTRMARRKPTLGVTDKIAAQYILKDEENHHDPHLWFNVELWMKAAEAVRDELKRFDPENAADYDRNATEYLARLAALHQWVEAELSVIQPKSRRVLVTAHDAFQYFGKAYDFEVRGVQGISTESAAGLKEINELAKFLAENQIKAVFVETSVPDKNMEQVLKSAWEDHKYKVVLGGRLYSDAMGKSGSDAETYEGMIRANVRTIVNALK